jgi:broad specificity phosphatase PhoE
MPNYFCMSCGKEYSDLTIKSNWFLVRHGETDWNKEDRIQGQTDTHLNETGTTQAEATANFLKDKRIDLIISSDLSRAKETAEIIARATGAEVIFDKALREINCGSLEGMFISEANEKYGGFLDRPYKELGGEALEEVEERAMKALRNHRKDHEHKNVVIVSHGALLGMVIKNIKKINHTESTGLKIGNAAAIKLEIGEPCDSCGEDLYEGA